MMQWITFLVIFLVSALVIIGNAYVYCRLNDYRRYMYLGSAFSFSVMLVGGTLLNYSAGDNHINGFSDDGNVILMVGMVLQMVVSGLFSLIRAGDKWAQDHNFYLKEWQKDQHKNQGSEPCKQQKLSVPPDHFRRSASSAS